MKKALTIFSIILLIFLWAAPNAYAQQEPKARHYLVSVFNAATRLPIGDFFSTPMHLGATACSIRYNRKPNNQWFQTAKILLPLYHRYVQSTVQLYSEFGYRRAIWRGTAAELRLEAAIAGHPPLRFLS